MGKRLERFKLCARAASLIGLLWCAAAPAAAQLCPTGTLCVTAWQQDTPSLCAGCAYRTGANLTETVINNSSIQNGTFGQLCHASLDGQVYAQPLVVSNVTIGTTMYKYVAYVVTQKDTLYAIDGDPADGTGCKILNGSGNGTSLLDGQYPVDCNHVGGSMACTQTLGPTVGILGTPVINISSSTAGTIYLVTQTQDVPVGNTPHNWYHWLHAVDIQSFNDTKVQICASGSCGVDSSTFSRAHIQRPGLLFANCGSSACGNANYVYVAFSMMDGAGIPYPNGAVFGYNVSNLGGSYFYFQTTLGGQQSSNGGGIWMGGAAPAFGPDADGTNWIYVTTANGTWDGSTNWGDSFLKLKPNGLTVSTTTSGYFTPADQWARQSPTCTNYSQPGDMDYGSGGTMLIPDNELTSWPHLAVNGDKEGSLWFMDRTTPGGINSCAADSCNLPPCAYNPPNNVQTYSTGNRVIHTNPAYWDYDLGNPSESYIYVAEIGGQLFQYALCASSTTGPIDYTTCPGTPVGSANGSSAISFSFGTTPTVSARGPEASDALVWTIDKTDGNAAQGTAPGILYAFDALTMQQLYSSNNSCAGDAIYPPTKRSVPTVANGYVYVGTEQTSGCPGSNCVNTGGGSFYIFGLGRQCS
jgi:hypothetical protein